MSTIWCTRIAAAACLTVNLIGAKTNAEPDDRLPPCFMPELEHYRQHLHELGLDISVASLRTYMESFTKPPSDTHRARFQSLIAQLGAEEYTIRESASRELGSIAHQFIPELRRIATTADDAEVRHRAAGALEAATKKISFDLTAAIHVVAADRLKGLTDTLLGAAEITDDQMLPPALDRALVATTGAENVQCLFDHLDPKHPESLRVLCIKALGEIRPGAAAEKLLPLLADESESVRIAAAVALAKLGERRALSTLVDMLSAGPLDARHLAGTTLIRWTGIDHGFRAYAPVADRTRAAEKWRHWLRTRDPHENLPGLRVPRGLGRVLAVRGNSLTELGPDARPTKELGGFNSLSEAIALRNGHRLVTDFHGRRVLEYDRDWKELRQIEISFQPRGSHPLPDGRLLVIGMHLFEIIDRAGVTKSRIPAPRRNMTGSLLLSSERFLVTCNDDGAILELDLNGHVKWRLKVANHPRSIQVLQDGRLLVADFRQAVIYSPEGKAEWSYALDGVRSAEQLPSGNLLLAHERGLTILDLGKRTLWEMPVPARRGRGFYAKTY